MKSIIFIAAVVGLACAAPREKRQVNCINPFVNIPNPCRNNPNNKVYFPHPTDNTMFLQCDIYNRMYIIKCPNGEVYDVSLTACRPPSAPATAAPPVVTAAPITVAPRPAVGNNPCTAAAVTRGQLYFALANDRTKFIECDLLGNPATLSCPSNLVWDQAILSCVYPINAAGSQPGAVNPTSTLPTTLQNPCTAQAINSGRFFFPHPDPTKFIQCDMWGNSFEVSCPNSLIWNAYLETCYQPVAGKK